MKLPFMASSVNVTKSAVSFGFDCRFGKIYWKILKRKLLFLCSHCIKYLKKIHEVISKFVKAQQFWARNSPDACIYNLCKKVSVSNFAAVFENWAISMCFFVCSSCIAYLQKEITLILHIIFLHKKMKFCIKDLSQQMWPNRSVAADLVIYWQNL